MTLGCWNWLEKLEGFRFINPTWQEKKAHFSSVWGRNIYISGEAVSGALILTPSFNRLQKSSSICTPGYGDAPAHAQMGGGGGSCINYHVKKRKTSPLLQEFAFLLIWIQMTGLKCDPILRLPREKISQRRTPKDHTSLWLVYTLSKILSGAIHFRGRRACETIRADKAWQKHKH